MKLTHHTIGITTPRITESRDFYTEHFGFQVVFQSEWYIHLRHSSGQLEIGLLQPDHPSQPPVFQSAYRGGGMWLSLEVEDVDAEYARLRERLPVSVEIRDEPWGERHFAVLDPSGVTVNVMKMVGTPQAVAG